MKAKGLHRLPTAFSSRSGKAIGAGLVAAIVATFAFVFVSPALAAGPVYSVMNTSETPPDGVWFRDNPNVSGPRLNGYGVYRGDRVELRCYGWGESLGAYANRLWYYSANVTRTSAPGRPNVGWLNAHYVNDNQNSNVVAPGVPPCGASPAPSGGGGSGGGGAPAATPTAYGSPCAPVTVIAIPGSDETNVHESPEHPVGKLSVVTQNLRSVYSTARLRIHYIPYPSQIVGTDTSHGVVTTYDWSRGQGYGAAWTALNNYASACPATRFVLLGYSQGAHIAGDLAATIGNHQPRLRDRILAVSLLGDAARDPNYRPLVGMNYSGGHGIRGSRGLFGFGGNRVVEYCAAHDPICDAGGNGALGRALVEKFRVGPHRSYDTAMVPGTNTTYTMRMANDLRARIS